MKRDGEPAHRGDGVMTLSPRDRLAGVLVPLFSIPSTASWGIGEFSDIPALARWAARAGFGMVQLLPLNEAGRTERSPYSPLTAMALDPQFISLRDVDDFAAIGGESALDDEARRGVADARAATFVDYPCVRAAKEHALRLCFDRFVEHEWMAWSARAQDLQRYIDDEAWWIDAYAVYRALRASQGDGSWRAWPEPLRRADPAAIEEARHDLEREVLFCQYVQWVAEAQWHDARRAAAPVAVFGDFPFMVTLNSADVWSRQGEFLLDASVGAPPDEFSETGQDWGLPPCNWSVMAEGGDQWMRQRVRRMSALFDGYRVDHLVGFYRTYVRFAGRESCFLPGSEAEQRAQGERLMQIVLASGARITVEDLGVVPPFVRASVERLGLHGYRVLRWEREWDEPGLPFRHPTSYPRRSVATTGTHDMETLAEWWESAPPDERVALLGLVTGNNDPARALARPDLDAETRDRVLEALYAAGSDLLVLPVQDLFGWPDRINRPGTLGGANWMYRLKWPVDRLAIEDEPRARAAVLQVWAERYGRS